MYRYRTERDSGIGTGTGTGTRYREIGTYPVEIKQSTSELRHFGFLKEFTLKFLVVLSNVYDFAKENSGVMKTTLVSAENTMVSAIVPLYNKLKDLPEGILVFVDDKMLTSNL
ncbi:REF/SRPP-like protein [Tanacetum coccineum]